MESSTDSRRRSLVLLTGATGYIGGRLLKGLEKAGWPVRCLARHPEFLRPHVATNTEVVKGDCLDQASLPPVMAGVHTAYYLVHSMGSSGKFEDEDRQAARNFAASACDNFECAEPWAHRTLAKHAKDNRPVLYSEKQLEHAETHDSLWNAAQMQMVNTGWMHNYVRMYWGKELLEWSPSPAQAYQIAVRLNDKYELDGRDPNGYAGIAWSIVGKFDRPWFERPVFGQIRYMSGESTGKKFDSKKYIQQNSLP